MARMIDTPVRRQYAEWLRESNKLFEFGMQLLQDPTFRDNSEDLGDWVDTVTTLLTFSPQPGPLGMKEFFPHD